MVTRIFDDDKVANLYAVCVILFYLPNFRTTINIRCVALLYVK